MADGNTKGCDHFCQFSVKLNIILEMIQQNLEATHVGFNECMSKQTVTLSDSRMLFSTKQMSSQAMKRHWGN